MDGQRLLVSLEERFWEAAGNPDFYRENFANDGMMALPVGLMTKPDVVDAMENASEWADFTFDDLRWVDVGDDVAALVYTTTAKRDTSDEVYHAAVTSVYANRGGQWLLVLHQQTPL